MSSTAELEADLLLVRKAAGISDAQLASMRQQASEEVQAKKEKAERVIKLAAEKAERDALTLKTAQDLVSVSTLIVTNTNGRVQSVGPGYTVPCMHCSEPVSIAAIHAFANAWLTHKPRTRLIEHLCGPKGNVMDMSQGSGGLVQMTASCPACHKGNQVSVQLVI